MALLVGKVVSGMGNFSYWIEKLQDHYRRKTGTLLFPGTLNVQLDHPYSLTRDVIRLEGAEYGERYRSRSCRAPSWAEMHSCCAPMRMSKGVVIIQRRSSRLHAT